MFDIYEIIWYISYRSTKYFSTVYDNRKPKIIYLNVLWYAGVMKPFTQKYCLPQVIWIWSTKEVKRKGQKRQLFSRFFTKFYFLSLMIRIKSCHFVSYFVSLNGYLKKKKRIFWNLLVRNMASIQTQMWVVFKWHTWNVQILTYTNHTFRL